jgi:hypothetical protein
MIVLKRVTNLKEVNKEINRLKAERITYKALLKADVDELKEALKPKELLSEMLHDTTNAAPGQRKWISDGVTTLAGVMLDRVFLKKMSFKQAMASTVKDVAVPALITRIKDIFQRKKEQPPA